MSSFLSFKKKRIILKILSYISTASLLLTFVILPAQPVAHADIVALDEMGAAGMITGYGAWNGTSLAYEIWDGVSSTFQTTGELIEGLWNQAYVELGTLPTYSDLGQYYNSGIIAQYDVYGEPYASLALSGTIVRALDEFYDWLCTEAGLIRDPSTGEFVRPSDFVSQPLIQTTVSYLEGVQLYALPFTFSDVNLSNYSNILDVGSSGNGSFVSGFRAGQSFVFISNGTGATITRLLTYPGNEPYVISTINTALTQDSGLYYSRFSWGSSFTTTSIPDSGINVDQWKGTLPSDAVVDTGTSSILPDPGPRILIPNPYDPDYDPQPVTIPTVIPYPPEYAPLPVPVPDPITGDFPENAPDPEEVAEAFAEPLIQGAIDGEIVADNPVLNPEPEPGPDPDAPVEVITPFLPVVFPSFNFSFSGIWHYVVEWVGTLGSWFSMVFTIWSHLPYAIVVPVYATAVVVIVLGVYKRFFM